VTLFSSPLLVIDTETTGFPEASWSRVIELAAVLLGTDGEEVAVFESFVRPDVLDSRADGALRVNCITAEMLADAPDTDAVRASFWEWLGMTVDPLAADQRAPYVTSFNVPFDRAMVERMGLTELRWASCIMDRATRIMGPLGLLRNADPSHPRYDPERPWLWPRLSLAQEHFGVPVVGTAHRALTDARTAAGIACAIRRHELQP
jgi:DNA polymerase III epsilon subunit-like protein